MIFLDYQDSRPIYEQIVEQYKHLILAGIMETDEQMPSVRALAMELSTNPNTIQKAFSELERQGFIYSVKGRGNFVKRNDALRDAHRLDLVRRMRSIRSESQDLGFDADALWQEASENGKEADA